MAPGARRPVPHVGSPGTHWSGAASSRSSPVSPGLTAGRGADKSLGHRGTFLLKLPAVVCRPLCPEVCLFLCPSVGLSRHLRGPSTYLPGPPALPGLSSSSGRGPRAGGRRHQGALSAVGGPLSH